MRTCSIISFSLLMLCAHGAQAQQEDTTHDRTAEVSLSNDTLQLRYISSGKQVHVDGSQFSAAFFLSEQRDVLLFAELMFPADLHLGALGITIGPRVYMALLSQENNDVMAMSIGTQLRLDLNKSRGFAILGEAYYAPDILTFGTANSVTDFMARAELRLAPRITGFAGYRWFEVDVIQGSGSNRKLEDGVFAGFNWKF